MADVPTAPETPASLLTPAPTPTESRLREFFDHVEERLSAFEGEIAAHFGTKDERASALSEALAAAKVLNGVIATLDPAASAISGTLVTALTTLSAVNSST